MEFTNLYQNGIEKAGTLRIILENLVVLGLITSGTVVVSPIRFQGFPVIAMGYVLFAVLMLGFVLRKHLCTTCWYHGKKCHCGWGIPAAKLFKQNPDNSHKFVAIEAAATWITIMALPLVVFLGNALLNDNGLFYWVGFGIFLVFVIGNNLLHKKSCVTCKMRNICVGSAAKISKG